MPRKEGAIMGRSGAEVSRWSGKRWKKVVHDTVYKKLVDRASMRISSRDRHQPSTCCILRTRAPHCKRPTQLYLRWLGLSVRWPSKKVEPLKITQHQQARVIRSKPTCHAPTNKILYALSAGNPPENGGTDAEDNG